MVLPSNTRAGRRIVTADAGAGDCAKSASGTAHTQANVQRINPGRMFTSSEKPTTTDSR
jgi:hypothetical protein